MESGGKRPLKVVVGLGKTGLSCVNYLCARGYKVAVTDSRPEPPCLKEIKDKFPDIEIQVGGFQEALLNRASELIVSPGVSIKEPAIALQAKRGIPILGDIELFARHANKPIVAITGSNGKSTVTSLLGFLAEQAGKKIKIGGNLGVPALELLDDGDTEFYILELSSFQLETTYTLKTLSSVILNISSDHMDRYENIEAYIHAKLRIYNRCKYPVINLDDPKSYQAYRFEHPPIGFTLKEPAENCYGLRSVNGQVYLAYGNRNLIPTKSLLLRGSHQYANVLATLAMGATMGLSLDSMLESICQFKGLPHRCQWVARINGVDWYNDSKATNVGSSQAAILGIGPEIPGKMVLLAGGQGKNADFSDLYPAVAKYVKKLILFGEDKYILSKTLEGAAPISLTDDLEAAVALAKDSATEGDVVMLSPACASYDMFNNFEHRGEVFINMVRRFA
jgi:UDP-N-acetylmuramoylalanine--D-glutamate ligase